MNKPLSRYLIPALLILAATVPLGTPIAHANPLNDDLLPADAAFVASLTAGGPGSLVAKFRIAKGYYLYRDKFQFEALDAGVVLGTAVFPKGIRKHDAYFGEVETYRKQAVIKMPVATLPEGLATLRVKVRYQGCADVGVCYPPQTKEFAVTLAATPATAETRRPTAALKSLVESLSQGEEDFLPADEAFRLTVDTAGPAQATARFDIAPGYYLYRDKIRFIAERPAGISVETRLPPGETRHDESLGKTQVFHDSFETPVSFKSAPAGAVVALKATYQGCAEKGICYPPVTKTFHVTLPGTVSETTRVQPVPAQAIAIQGLLLAAAGAFSAGLLLSFTPCVLPMIPILSGMIVGQGTHLTKWRAGLLSMSYVLGTALTYTVAGVLAGYSGQQLQAYFQNPWVIGSFSLVFAAMALSMFGLYEFEMPGFLQARMQARASRAQAGGGSNHAGLFVCGVFSALIVGACVSPVLIGVIGAAIRAQDPLLGGMLMFSMAIGMGVILVVAGVSTGHFLPKAGPWMDQVKYGFGVLLLGVAIYLLSPIEQLPILLLWAALFIITGVYLGATQQLPIEAGGWRFFWKGIGTLLLLWGLLALVGGLYRGRDILHPLPDFTPSGHAVADVEAPLFRRMERLDDIETELRAAKNAGRPAIVDFYATWCTDCVRMEKSTFRDPRVRAALRHFVLIQADVSENDELATALKGKFGVFGPPAMLFFGRDGAEIGAARFYGYRDADALLTTLDGIDR